MTEKKHSILNGNTFIVTDGVGNVHPSGTFPTGLFSFDTRFLSSWNLTLDGQEVSALSRDDVQYFRTRFFLVPGEPTHYVDAKLSIIREQSIRTDFIENITVFNHDLRSADIEVNLAVASDFADIFEVKDVRQKSGRPEATVNKGSLVLTYERGSFVRETRLYPSMPANITEDSLTFHVHLGPRCSWETELRVEMIINRAIGPESGKRTVWDLYRARKDPQPERGLERWLAAAPVLQTDNGALLDAYRRSLVDLSAMRFTTLSNTKQPLPTAGLPWFMTVFGRDSIFICLQLLPFVPTVTPPVLKLLALLQGGPLDDFREEEPGKILHELRYGESAAFEEQPHTPYYGSADATPLFVILLDEYERWTGDVKLVRSLEHNARAALAWIDTYGNLLGNGYVSYARRNEQSGLENQCWKDSWDSLSYKDGSLPEFPRATCEIQGYAYDAKIRGARMAREIWNDDLFAKKLENEAAELKERFNRDFWVAEEQYYAVALDPQGRPVDTLTSNMGHLLWSGLVEADRAGPVVKHLLGPDLFSGWGIRTLAKSAARYNPVGYHVGTVWPFDNSIIAWGLRRYGFASEAAKVAEAIIQASTFFHGRLPEAFAGYERTLTGYPVEYPTACSPQGWSAGATLLFLRTMLGLNPHHDHLAVDPHLPSSIRRIELMDIPGRWGRSDAYGRYIGRRTKKRNVQSRSSPPTSADLDGLD